MEETFSIDNIQPIFDITKPPSPKDYFTSQFTFPSEHRDAVLKYLRKNKQRIIEQIIKEAEEK